jgi:hypothetical protein
MKPSNLFYLALGAIALFAAIAIPVSVYRSSSAAAPRWVSAVEPGPLSKAHAFLENKCESCHTPNSGVKAQNCITCHAAATDLLMKPATAFHAKISECAFIRFGVILRTPVGRLLHRTSPMRFFWSRTIMSEP